MLGRTGNAINSYRFKRRLVNSDLKWTYEEQETLLMYVVLDHLNRVVNYEELSKVLGWNYKTNKNVKI